ncbi:MAG TPA: hypothetical protein VI072_31235 [Polyangiaceae bacterium]
MTHTGSFVLQLLALVSTLAFFPSCRACATEGAPAPAPARPVSSALSEPLSARPLGIPECDSYLTNYEKCLASKVPSGERASLRGKAHIKRAHWQELASAKMKENVVNDCKKAADAAKSELARFSCAW